MSKANVWVRKRQVKRGTTYAVQWQEPRTGKVKTESTGKDKTYAKHRAAEIRKEIMSGVYKGITAISYDDFVCEHLDRVTKGSFETHSYALRKLGAICRPKNLTVVDFQMLEAFVGCRIKEGVSPYTVNKNLRALQSAFSKAVKRGYLKENPINKDNRKDLFVAEPEKNPTVLAENEFDAILEKCPDDTWRAMCKIAYNSGLRRNEILFLAWDDVDYANKTVTICNSEDHSTKSKKVRMVPMNREIVEALKPMRSQQFKNTFIFRQYITDKCFSSRFARIVIRAGYTVTVDGRVKNKYSFHDLRRTFGTNLANRGVSPKVLQKLMGHAKLETTMKYYVNADMDEKRKAVDLLVAKTA